MRKKVAFIAGLACVAFLGGLAVTWYGYGPLLRSNNGPFRRWAAYYEGWFAGMRERLHGHLSYSFSRYMIEGLREYASSVDSIDCPKPPVDAASEGRYVWGFDSAMEGAIGRKLRQKFPEEYVQQYLASGWIDLSQQQPMSCLVHRLKMEVTNIPFKIVFPFTMPHEPFEWEIAGQRYFPFAGISKKVDASILARPRYARVRVCAACTKAELEWLDEHPRYQQILNPGNE